MSDIQRYSTAIGRWGAQDPAGEFVRHSDHIAAVAALEARIAELEKLAEIGGLYTEHIRCKRVEGLVMGSVRRRWPDAGLVALGHTFVQATITADFELDLAAARYFETEDQAAQLTKTAAEALMNAREGDVEEEPKR